MDDNNNHLLQPLLIQTTTTTSSSSSSKDPTLCISQITIRLSLIFFIGITSIWANHEASKGFNITIVNEISNNSLSHRFDLFFVKNDRAVRIVLNTSSFAERILYPHQNQLKKTIQGITIKLTDHHQNPKHLVLVHPSNKNDHEYVIHVSSSVMQEVNVDKAMVSAIQRGMARVWLWDGAGDAPNSLIAGMVEYISNVIGQPYVAQSMPGSCEVLWKDGDYVAVANYLSYCEKRRNGFVGWLNQAMKDGWDEGMVANMLGLPGIPYNPTHKPN